MNRITSNPDICHGKPCIRGLRYPVQSVLEWLAGGMTVADVLEDYPDLEADDIYAALALTAAGRDAVHTLNLPDKNMWHVGNLVCSAA